MSIRSHLLHFPGNSAQNKFERGSRSSNSARLDPLHIERVRANLMERSNTIRIGLDPTPRATARRLAGMALAFAASEAPAFEQSATLVQTYGNLLAGEVMTPHTRRVGRLAHTALEHAYPHDTRDRFTRDLNDATRATYQLAAQITTPDKPFSLALEEAWEMQGVPIDPLIEQTEAIALAAYQRQKQAHKERIASEATGAFTPPNFDD